MNRNAQVPTHPCSIGPEAPGLFTYYVFMALIVIIMTVTLIWIPFVQLIGEFNNLMVKLVIFMDRELLGNHFDSFLGSLEKYFVSQETLVMMALFCITYVAYLASWDVLAFVGCYIATLPDYKFLKDIKTKALNLIEALLCLSVKKRCVKFNRKVRLMYYNPGRSDCSNEVSSL